MSKFCFSYLYLIHECHLLIVRKFKCIRFTWFSLKCSLLLISAITDFISKTVFLYLIFKYVDLYFSGRSMLEGTFLHEGTFERRQF